MYKKKSLGQHFLRDPRILAKIADAAALSTQDTVVEIGPGEGTLTAALLERAGRVIAIEKDDRLVPLLERAFGKEIAEGRLVLIHADVLELSSTFYPLPSGYKLVANLPYYITGQFFRKFLQETECPPETMVLLLQKEVAKRIVAHDKKAKPSPSDSVARPANGRFRESILSISIKAYGTPKYIDTVKAGSFSPPPRVDSAILTIENISKDFFKDGHQNALHESVHRTEERFFEALRKGFAHPRKLLASNLDVSASTLRACGIDEKARAESLSLAEWKQLTHRMVLGQNTRGAQL